MSLAHVSELMRSYIYLYVALRIDIMLMYISPAMMPVFGSTLLFLNLFLSSPCFSPSCSLCPLIFALMVHSPFFFLFFFFFFFSPDDSLTFFNKRYFLLLLIWLLLSSLETIVGRWHVKPAAMWNSIFRNAFSCLKKPNKNQKQKQKTKSVHSCFCFALNR